MLQGQSSTRISDYHVELEDEEIRVRQLASADAQWRQLRLALSQDDVINHSLTVYEPGLISDITEDGQAYDLAWIQENLGVFWLVAEEGYRAFGRGAIVIHAISRPDEAGNPFVYVPETEIEKMADPSALQMIRTYDPTWELMAMFLKSGGRVCTYRTAVVG